MDHVSTPGKKVTSADLRAATRGPRLLGLVVVALFFGVGGCWAALAPLASAVLAPGVISPEGSRRTIQHLEGGIIREIHVRDGSAVERGDPLVTLEDKQARSQYESVLAEYVTGLANEARLIAEQLEAPDIDFPDELHARSQEGDGEAKRLMRTQRDLFASRLEARAGRERILAQRASQFEAENEGLLEVVAAQDEQLRLVDAEIADVEGLLDKGYERRPRLLALRREHAEVAAERAENLTRIASNEWAIGEALLQRHAQHLQQRESVDAELSEVRARLEQIRSGLPSSMDALARTVVSSPMPGTVVELSFTTQGGVIGPGEPILDLVPAQAELLVEARIRPQDIDDISAGQKAEVLLSAYKQRNLPKIHGNVRDVSADRLIDERSGDPYFLARIEVSQDELMRAASQSGIDVSLAAGMPADIMIVTGERTTFDYLFQPLTDSLRRSFKES